MEAILEEMGERKRERGACFCESLGISGCEFHAILQMPPRGIRKRNEEAHISKSIFALHHVFRLQDERGGTWREIFSSSLSSFLGTRHSADSSFIYFFFFVFHSLPREPTGIIMYVTKPRKSNGQFDQAPDINLTGKSNHRVGQVIRQII